MPASSVICCLLLQIIFAGLTVKNYNLLYMIVQVFEKSIIYLHINLVTKVCTPDNSHGKKKIMLAVAFFSVVLHPNL